MKLDLVRAMTQPFSGANWPVNLLIGAVATLVGAFAAPYQPIGGLVQLATSIFIAGYAVGVVQNVLGSYRNTALPEWFKDWQSIGIQGMNATFGIWAWTLVVGTLAGFVAAKLGTSIAMTVGGTALVAGALVLKAVFLLTLGLLTVHYAATNNIAAFIQVGTVVDRIRANPLGVVVASVATLGILWVPGLALAIPTVGVFGYAVVHFAGYLVIANLWAQVYKG
jgi:hypothetical protein